MLTFTGLKPPEEIDFFHNSLRAFTRLEVIFCQTCLRGARSALPLKVKPLTAGQIIFLFVCYYGRKTLPHVFKAWWMFPLAVTIASGKWQTAFEPEEEKVGILPPLGDKLHSGKQLAPELMQTCIEQQRNSFNLPFPTHGVGADQFRVFPVNMALNTLETRVLNFRCTSFD